MENLAIVVASIAILMTVISWIGLAWGLIELRAMQKATHSIQYVDVPAPIGVDTDENGFETLTPKKKAEIGDEDDLFGDETVFTSLN